MADEKNDITGKLGVIPDFFHDIIAYIIPGYALLIFLTIDLIVLGEIKISTAESLGLKSYSISIIAAYIIGRFFEQFGYMTIHHGFLPKLFPSYKAVSPKWGLIFDSKDNPYTESFKANVKVKISEWLIKQQGHPLMSECEKNQKDDYFNLIQFYLRERFPSVALYEKKQNATIIMNRSLAIIGIFNIIAYHLILVTYYKQGFEWGFFPCYLIAASLGFSLLMYQRFKQDKIYHAMYIFETFIAMKKLLKSKQTPKPANETSQ